MASRLSEESLSGIYDSGFKSLSRFEKPAQIATLLPKIDFQAILAEPNAAELVEALPPQQLYLALSEQGPENCLDVLPLLSAEQFGRIMDYDSWREDTLSPKQGFYWLGLYGSIQPRQMYERYCSLDEEYQLALLSPFIRVYDADEYEKMSDEEQDRLYSLPGDAFYYAIRAEDKEIHKGIEDLLQATMAEDAMDFVISLLLHTSYMPPNESAHLLEQFRKARLEEDGFITYQESQTCFIEENHSFYKSKWEKENSSLSSHTDELRRTDKKSLFLDEVLSLAHSNTWTLEQLETIQHNFLFLANNLCAASLIDADDTHSLRYILEHARGLCSMALEYLSDSDKTLAARILIHEHPKTLFRVALGLVEETRRQVLADLSDRKLKNIEKFSELSQTKKFGQLLDWIDKHLLSQLGFEYCEVLKGLFNRFPLFTHESPHESSVGSGKILFSPLTSVSDLNSFRKQLLQ